MSKESNELIKRLDALVEKLDVLTKVSAMSKQTWKLLEGKKQKEQIQILKRWDLSNEMIALIVGTTPDVVAVRLSEMKSKERQKRTKAEEKREESQ